MNWITPLFLFALCLNVFIEIWLNVKNQFYIGKHRQAVPEEFSEVVTLEAIKKRLITVVLSYNWVA